MNPIDWSHKRLATSSCTLGVDLAAGRDEAAEPPAVISHRLWQTRFGGDRAVVGRTITVNSAPYVISGVAASGFGGMSLDASVDIWLLLPAPTFVPPSAIARLRPGVTMAQAQAATDVLLQGVDRDQGVSDSTGPIRTEIVAAGQGSSELRERYRRPLLALLGLVGLVLLITCTNVGNLLVVRNAGRARELTLRVALGASRSRLVTQLLVEGVLLAVVSGAAAWLVAEWGVHLLVSTLPEPGAAGQLAFRTDLRTLGFMGLLSCVSAALFTLAPAWRATRVDLTTSLKDTATLVTARGTRLGLWLVGGQVALSVILLTGAGLFVQTVRNMTHVDLGFDPHHLVEVELADRAIRYRPEEFRGIEDALLERIRAIPGVREVALYGNTLLPSYSSGEQPAEYSGGMVGVGFYEAMRIPLVRGRLFTAADVSGPETVAVINEAFAKQYFPGEDPLGKRAGHGNFRIVGVVRDAKLFNLRWTGSPTVHRLAERESRLVSGIEVRTSIDPAGVIGPIEDAVRSVNPRLLTAVRTVDTVIARSIARERMVATTGALFGLLGLVLAGMGLFGIAAFAVARRTSELGLRIALGAGRWDVIRESLREPTRVVVFGLVAGVVTGLVMTRWLGSLISGLLFGLTPADWSTIVIAALLLLLVAVVACLMPAYRATRVDPLVVLRRE